MTFILATQFNSKTSKPLNASLGLTLIDKSQDMHFNLLNELHISILLTAYTFKKLDK